MAIPGTPLLGDVASDGIVAIKVGRQQQLYHVHKALLTHYSEYFRVAFNGQWRESDENSVTIDDIEPEAFKIFIHWAYTRTMPTFHEGCHIVSGCIQDAEGPQDPEGALLLALVKSIAFGDRFLVPAFRQAANNAIVDFVLDEHRFRGIRFILAVTWAFENLPKEDTINQFFLESRFLFCWYENESMVVEELVKNEVPLALLASMIARHAAKEARETLGWGGMPPRCMLHEHMDEQDQESCVKCSSCTCWTCMEQDGS